MDRRAFTKTLHSSCRSPRVRGTRFELLRGAGRRVMASSQAHALDKHGHFITSETEEKTFVEKLLDVVERVGNKVPHPVVIFVLLIGLVMLLSHLFYLAGLSVSYQAINPRTDQLEDVTTSVRS